MRHRVLLMISSMQGGGSEQQTLLLLRHLDRSQFEPHLYVLHRDGELMSQLPDDVPVHCYADHRSEPQFYVPGRVSRDQVRHLKGVLRQQAIDVVYDRTFHMTLIAAPACAAQQIPHVSTIVSPPNLAVPMVESHFVRLKRRRLGRAYRRARAVIAVSKAAADAARVYYRLPADKLLVIPNSIDVPRAVVRKDEYRVSRDDRLTIVCVGRMSAEKGHRDLINALLISESQRPQSAPAVQLWLIGDGQLRTELETLAGGLTGRHRVDFLGQLANPLPYVAAADALVLPSRFEGMPNVVLEAMAIETPVIATRCGGTVELEGDEPTIWWCQPGDPSSLAAAIREFHGQPEAVQQRVAAANRLVTQQHDASDAVRRIEQQLNAAVRWD